MQICTFTLTSGNNIVIAKSMYVVQFSVIAESASAAMTIKGNAGVLNSLGVAITNVPIPLSTGQGYNSIPANSQSPWDGVVISCTAGSINVILTTD